MPVLYSFPQPAQPARGCTETSKRTRAATLQRVPSALAEIQRNPLQPEPPTYAAAPRGDRGENKMIFPPAALRARVDDPSTRESGPLPQLPAANKKTDEPQTRPFLFHFFNSRVKANAEPSSTSSSRILCPCISKMR